jgi:hypothetical protein
MADNPESAHAMSALTMRPQDRFVIRWTFLTLEKHDGQNTLNRRPFCQNGRQAPPAT